MEIIKNKFLGCQKHETFLSIKKAQENIFEFDKARGWEDKWYVKDLALNMNEEIGELWNLIKWVNEAKQKQIASEHIDKVSDFIGDTLFLILKIANQANIDADKALQETLDEYEKRMPPETMKKVKHANKLAGGIDNKQKSD